VTGLWLPSFKKGDSQLKVKKKNGVKQKCVATKNDPTTKSCTIYQKKALEKRPAFRNGFGMCLCLPAVGCLLFLRSSFIFFFFGFLFCFVFINKKKKKKKKNVLVMMRVHLVDCF
jgi:hypothetical protein